MVPAMPSLFAAPLATRGPEPCVERRSFFPPSGVRVCEAESGSFGWGATPAGVSASRRSELSHQQKVKAKHTICQWRRMEMSFLTW
jgi:hypothetical protein